MTAADLLEGNADFLDRAIEILKRDIPRRFDLLLDTDGSKLRFGLSALDVDSFDVFVDGCPFLSGEFDEHGQAEFAMDDVFTSGLIEVVGYYRSDAVAKRKIKVD